MGATDYRQPMDHPFPLEVLAVPVLDIFGEEDYPAVRRLAPSRLRAMAVAGHNASRQLQIAAADHDYAAASATASLLEEISAWLAEIQFNRLP
jgi:pimeloyl-ACP methyl ester carboxylesterase